MEDKFVIGWLKSISVQIDNLADSVLDEEVTLRLYQDLLKMESKRVRTWFEMWRIEGKRPELGEYVSRPETMAAAGFAKKNDEVKK